MESRSTVTEDGLRHLAEKVSFLISFGIRDRVRASISVSIRVGVMFEVTCQGVKV